MALCLLRQSIHCKLQPIQGIGLSISQGVSLYYNFQVERGIDYDHMYLMSIPSRLFNLSTQQLYFEENVNRIQR